MFFPGQPTRPGPGQHRALTEEAAFFSFLWSVHSPLETSSSVVVPS